MDGWTTITLSYINITLFIFLESKLLWCERDRQDGGRWRQTAILTHINFSWSYHTVLSSRPHLAFSAASEACCGLSWVLSVTASWLRLSHGHLHVSFYHAYDFQSTMWLLPFIYTGMFCSEKSLIDGLVKGQYATFILWIILQCHEFDDHWVLHYSGHVPD